MKTSPLLALSAFLFLRAQACVRVRVDRYLDGGYSYIQEVKLYDNDSPVRTAGQHQFVPPFDEIVKVEDYYVKLQYKDGKHHPYGGRIQYPKGRKSTLRCLGQEAEGIWVLATTDLC